MENIKKHRYKLSVLTILLLATCMRFYGFEWHWGLGSDDARDALIAREAISRKEIPIMGSFSSAGPFAFGPLFYWVVIASYIVLPFTFVAPWIITGLTGVLTVLVLLYCGKLIGGEKLALITGVLATTSPQMINRSLSLGQHTYVALTASLLLLSFILLWQQKKVKYAFFMGLSLGAALSMHYQTINLLIFFGPLLLIPQTTIKKKIVMIIVMTIGVIIPSVPTIMWELGQSFANTRNILDYLLVGQYRIYVPNSWKLFLGQFLPQYWSFVTGGYQQIGIIVILITTASFAYKALTKNLESIWWILSGILFTLLFVNRFYRGERSEGYLLYLLPLTILFTSYALKTLIFDNLFKNKFKIIISLIGIIVFITVITGNLMQYQKYVAYKSPVKSFQINIEELKKKYPDQRFSVYDYKWQHSNTSQAFSFLLEMQGKADVDGMPIGILCPQDCETTLPQIGNLNEVPLYDLTNQPNLKTNKDWVNVNQQTMYDDLMKWSKTEKLQSNFNF